MKQPNESELPPLDQGAAFRTTHWSLVLSAGDPNSPQATEPLEKLCRAYWYPLYAFLRRLGKTRRPPKI